MNPPITRTPTELPADKRFEQKVAAARAAAE
jgi:hypothetical protein